MKAVTFMAEDSGVIAKLTQKAIMTGAPDFALKRIKDITYDTSKGHNPRWVRVYTTPPPREQYQPLLPSGNQSYNVVNPQTGEITTVTGDKTGRGCSLAASTMAHGYDVQQRCIQGRAIEAGPWCVLDLIEKQAWQEIMERIRRDMPMYGKDQFSSQLLRDIIKYSKFKFSLAEGFPMSVDSPYFPAVPTGGPSVGFIRQIADMVMPWGWKNDPESVDGLFQVYMGSNAIEWAIQQRKVELGLTITSTPSADDKTLGKKTAIYENIQWVPQDQPTRGYLRKVGSEWEFVEIDPTITVAASGEGFKPEPNPDYYKSWVTVDGATYRVLEVGYYLHPSAMVRESLGSMPRVPGKSSTPMRFDFTVNPIPDWELAARGCNKDLFFFGYRMLHAYAPRPVNPELMGAFLYVAPAVKYSIVDPWADTVAEVTTPVNVAPLPNSPASGCEPCDIATGAVDREVNQPTCSDQYPANGVGVITLRQSAYDVSEEAGNLTVVVERKGGDSGAASCVMTITEGTATNPENFTTPSGFAGSGPWTKTISWLDGEAGVKTVVVPIVEAAGDDSDKAFTVGIGTFTGSASGTITSATVTILDADEE